VTAETWVSTALGGLLFLGLILLTWAARDGRSDEPVCHCACHRPERPAPTPFIPRQRRSL
jgi:hypothetical protein